MSTHWTFEMLGKLRLLNSHIEISNFRTTKSAEMLAHLAYFDMVQHPREVLIELLWPEVELRAGRNRLKQELCSLNGMLDRPDELTAPIIRANRSTIQLVKGAITTDVSRFRNLVRHAVSE